MKQSTPSHLIASYFSNYHMYSIRIGLDKLSLLINKIKLEMSFVGRNL